MKRIFLPVVLIAITVVGYEYMAKFFLNTAAKIETPSEYTWEDMLQDCRPDLYEKMDRLNPDSADPFTRDEKEDYMAEVNSSLQDCYKKRLGAVSKILGD